MSWTAQIVHTIELTLLISYLESTIILALVIVNPALIMISTNSPILGVASGLIKANVLKEKEEIQPTLLFLKNLACMLSLYSDGKAPQKNFVTFTHSSPTVSPTSMLFLDACARHYSDEIKLCLLQFPQLPKPSQPTAFHHQSLFTSFSPHSDSK